MLTHNLLVDMVDNVLFTTVEVTNQRAFLL